MCSTGSGQWLVIDAAVGLELPEQIGYQCHEEDDQGVFGLSDGAYGEGYADVAQAAWNGVAIGLDVRGGGEECEEGEADDEPDVLQALSGCNENHAPTDEDGSAEVEGPVELEIEVASIEESMRAQRPEGNDGFGYKKMPSEAQKAKRDKPEGS